MNPGSLILSGVMMMQYLGWAAAVDLIVKGLQEANLKKRVTCDFARLMDGPTELKCPESGSAIIENM